MTGKLFSKSTKKSPGISLMFGRRVIVTESYIPDFSLSSFFASLGGSLGLWLGVGAVQLITNGVSLFTWIREKLR